MDANDLRIVATVLAFVCFVGIVVWAYSRRIKARFDEAARLPFDDEMPLTRPQVRRAPLHFRPNGIDDRHQP